MSDRVSIRYMNGTSVEASNLHDALVHLVHTGTDYVEEVVEDVPATVPCPHCEGRGVKDGPRAKRLLTKKQAQDRIDEINETAPVATSSFDDRVAAVRSLSLD